MELVIILTLVRGGIYTLLAIGFSLIYGNARVINLAHTAFFMVAIYGLYYFTRQLGLGIIPAIAITLPAVTLLGILAYRFLINPIRMHPGAVLLMTVALAMVFEELMLEFFTSQYQSVYSYIPGYQEILGVRVLNQHLLTLGVVVAVIIIVRLILTKTKLGVAVRATADDAEVASLMGISVPRTLMITMGIATALAGVAAITVAPLWTIYPNMWTPPLVMVMVIVVLGGLGSVKGSIIGAFIIALVETLIITQLSRYIYLTTVFATVVMAVVLVVRPGGLFGVMFEEEKL
ncbi:MAG: branched-chain amino acid ABC transporter permease [Dehalococcoidia bacterium]|nr:branched-chain amino acid ABC transporter permease [Dehalococcoidia bacterium]